MKRAVELGLENKVKFIEGDAFSMCKSRDFDLVYWNNSLHHMLNVERAISWSLDRLQSGGVFAMDDFVGPSRFQWTDTNLRYASLFRRSLPKELLIHPKDFQKYLKVQVDRPSIDAILALDPTEAADSGRILKSINQLLPDAKVIPTGGAIYHIGINDVIGNITSDHASIIELGLLIDRILMEQGEFQYAVCVHSI